MDSPHNPYSPPTVPVDPPPPAYNLAGELARYEPGGGRATVSIVLLYITAAVQLLGIAGSAYTYVAMGRAQRGELTEADLALVDGVNAVNGLLELLVLIGCIIAFCMWFYRAYRNLYAFGVAPAHSPGWAPGSFFIPFLNLVRPFQIAREIWLGSAIEYGGGNGLVSLWWGLFLGGNIVGNISWRVSGDTPGSVQAAQVLLVISNALSIGAAFACVKMIKGIEQRQAAHHQHQMREDG